MNDMKHDTDMISRVRKGSLYSFIAFLGISALLAITSVLSGKFGEFEIKVLITTSVIAVASICSLCCSAYTSRSQNSLPGVAGVSFAGISAAMLIIGVWAEMDSEGYWKTTAVLSVFAIAFAHSLALLAVRLRPTHSWLQLGTAINIFALAAIISIMIVGEIDGEGMLKLVAILAILAGLETLVIPIVGRLAKTALSQVRETLSLTKREDGVYEDKRGRLYEVNEMSNNSMQATPNGAPDG
jgi:hypothetical protein